MGNSFHERIRSAVEELPEDLRVAALKDLSALERHGAVDEELLGHLVANASEPAQLRAIGAWAIGVLQEPSLAGQLEAVIQREDSPEALLWEATKSLCKLGRGVSIFRRLVVEGHTAQARKAAAYALGCLQNQEATADLCRVLSSTTEVPAVRGQVAEALGYLRDRSAFSSLLQAVHDPSAEVRYWTAFALGQLGDRRAEPVLERLRQHDLAQVEDWGTVAEEADRALDELRGSTRE